MGKHAYLIMAHNRVEMLQQLIDLLDDTRNDIFIHWDKKSPDLDWDSVAATAKMSKVFFVPRTSVMWGGSSLTQCIMDLFSYATKHNPQNPYDYYHLISGVDLPLGTPDEIHAFFDANPGTEYMDFDRDPSRADERLRYFYFFQNIYGRNRKNILYIPLYIFDTVLLPIQRLLKINRLKHESFQYQKGSAWFSITHACALHLVSQQSWVRKRCRFTFCSDEVFAHMIVWNSEFRDRLNQGGFGKSPSASRRLIDWVRGTPYTLRNDDYDYIMSSSELFARKFDSAVDETVIKRIYAEISQRKNQQAHPR